MLATVAKINTNRYANNIVCCNCTCNAFVLDAMQHTKDIQENQFQVVFQCMLLIKGHFTCDIRYAIIKNGTNCM